MRLLIASIVMAVFSFAFITPTGKSSVSQERKKWSVPEAAKKAKNPQAANAENAAAGKEIYNKHCKSCHGGGGKGDGPKSSEIETPMPDFTKELAAQTDGELFYKTKEGRDDMPSFKKKLPDDEDIWNVVNYMRTMKK